MNPDCPLGCPDFEDGTDEYSSLDRSEETLELPEYSLSLGDVNPQRLRDRQLRAFFERALDAMLIADDEGIYVDVNPAACELFGLPKEALLGQRIVDFAEPGFDFTAAWESFQRDEHVKAEFRLVRPDGEVREVEFAATANFVPHRHLSVLRDITKRKQAETDLKLNEARYRAIVEDQTELICRALPNRIVTFVNQAYCRYFGQSSEALIGHSFTPLIPEEERAQVQQHFSSLGRDNPMVTYEHRVILPSGEVRWQQWVDRAIFTAEGEFLEIQSVGRDITQQKAADLELQQLNQELEQRVQQRTADLHQALDYLQFHVENSSLAFIGCDHDACIQFWSQRAEQIFGWQAKEVLGKHWKDLHLVHEDDLTDVLDIIEQLQCGETSVTHSNRNYRKDGSVVYCEWHNSAQLDEAGNLISILSLVQDVSDRKRAEDKRNQAEEALRQREILLREAQRVAHVGSWEFDLAAQTIHWSEEMFHIFGLDPTQAEPTYSEYLQMLHPDDSEQLQHLVERCIQAGIPYELEHRIIRLDGSTRYLIGRAEPVLNEQGQVVKLFGAGIDITVHKLVEEQLRQSEARLTAAQRVAHVGSWELDISTQKITWSEEVFHIFGFDPNQPEPSYEAHLQQIHPDDQPLVQAAIDAITTTGNPFSLDFRILKSDGSVRYIEGKGEAYITQQGKPVQLYGTLLDITERKQLEAELRSQAAREQLLRTITQHIHRSLNLNQILTTTVTEVRQVLQADRVLVFRFKPDWSGVVVVESVIKPELSVLETSVKDPCFSQRYAIAYRHGRIQVTDDIYKAKLKACHVDFLKGFQVRASLVVPILLGSEEPQVENTRRSPPALWGLLIAHQCSEPRYWQSSEIDLMKQLATQAGIAIQQAEFHHQVQRFNAELERQVRARTAELQLASEFESTLKRITDRVRDSLDETQILESAVEELAKGLGVNSCNAALFDMNQGTSTICFEYTTQAVSPSHGRVSQMADFPEIYSQLLSGLHFQFCSLILNPSRGQVAMLCCPIFDDQGVLGDLWLINQSYYGFSEQDIRLVQQVANQCAIALRQSRLYQAAQAQVQELERLNQLKDDFLSTVSHELRTPMSNIKMATQMLEIALKEEPGLEKGGEQSSQGTAGQRSKGASRGQKDKSAGENRLSHPTLSSPPKLTTPNPKVAHYFSILKDECQREISLINDLLDLARLDAGTELLIPNPLDLSVWLPPITEPFIERARSQQQQLILDIPDTLPSLVIDQSYLGRILSELLNNACKYTPAEETITVAVRVVEQEQGLRIRDKANSTPAFILPCGNGGAEQPPCLQLSVTNSGVEIPVHELSRIFDKFYRIPNNDPWKYGGTGLGLALVKKLTERIGGSIQVESLEQKTRFIVKFPLQ